MTIEQAGRPVTGNEHSSQMFRPRIKTKTVVIRSCKADILKLGCTCGFRSDAKAITY